MATTKELTGGTGDVNPQLLNVLVTQTAADANTEGEVALPIPRYNAKSGRSIVLEILRISCIISDMADPAADAFVSCFLKTRTGALITDPECFATFSWDYLFTSAVGFAYHDRRRDVDLSDGAGHGYLVATDSIFASCNSAATGLTNAANFKILYRYKEVSLAEYIGIVQSQQ